MERQFLSRVSQSALDVLAIFAVYTQSCQIKKREPGELNGTQDRQLLFSLAGSGRRNLGDRHVAVIIAVGGREGAHELKLPH